MPSLGRGGVMEDGRRQTGYVLRVVPVQLKLGVRRETNAGSCEGGNYEGFALLRLWQSSPEGHDRVSGMAIEAAREDDAQRRLHVQPRPRQCWCSVGTAVLLLQTQ
jgi:hypothetical protein